MIMGIVNFVRSISAIYVLSVDRERKCWLVAPRGGTGSRPPPTRLPCRSEYNWVQNKYRWAIGVFRCPVLKIGFGPLTVIVAEIVFKDQVTQLLYHAMKYSQ